MQRSIPTRTTSTGSRTTASSGSIVSVEGPRGWRRGQHEGPRVLSTTAMMVAPQFWLAILRVVVGICLAVNYGLATQWMSFGQQGFHLLLTTSMIILVGARAGRAWGIDALILSHTRAAATRWLKLVM